jgi:hypothetical protein
MNSSLGASRLSKILGSMQDANFLRHSLSVRCSRTHLLAAGIHIDASTLAEQAGFRVRVFFRREAFDRLTQHDSHIHDGSKDLYDAVLSLRQAMTKAPLRNCPVLFQVEGVTLVAHPGAVDHDDPRPALTVVLAGDCNNGGQDDE